MLIILTGSLSGTFYSFTDKIKGKKVIATKVGRNPRGDLLVKVRYSELIRIGVVNAGNLTWSASEDLCFLNTGDHTNDFNIVKPKLQNCTDLSVGNGYEGYYDQPPVKKSHFR